MAHGWPGTRARQPILPCFDFPGRTPADPCHRGASHPPFARNVMSPRQSNEGWSGVDDWTMHAFCMRGQSPEPRTVLLSRLPCLVLAAGIGVRKSKRTELRGLWRDADSWYG
ncbi:hypothetical protein BRADI_1g24772v3 [Brachypodium distachyon]|uniref:Uncharacterized protein n=1 Tax=Brachypodium distachyon TaxID=15368 RepID=A0A2K2DKY1_BRADI|nr:hypothetical protein BRADI_1g24772v3 [Brachypodium distachyon]